MSGGAYTNKPERRIRQLKDVLTSAPRTFDAAMIGAGKCAAVYTGTSSSLLQTSKTDDDHWTRCSAGVVGLAVCRALALEGQQVILFEQAKAIGTETSSRNSEVIHSGVLSSNFDCICWPDIINKSVKRSSWPSGQKYR